MNSTKLKTNTPDNAKKEANARLIAASPDLLHAAKLALLALLPTVPDEDIDFDYAREKLGNAIAKAEGRG